jgi:hypothetical protein
MSKYSGLRIKKKNMYFTQRGSEKESCENRALQILKLNET